MEVRFLKRQKIYRIFHAFPLRLELIHRFFHNHPKGLIPFFNPKLPVILHMLHFVSLPKYNLLDRT